MPYYALNHRMRDLLYVFFSLFSILLVIFLDSFALMNIRKPVMTIHAEANLLYKIDKVWHPRANLKSRKGARNFYWQCLKMFCIVWLPPNGIVQSSSSLLSKERTRLNRFFRFSSSFLSLPKVKESVAERCSRKHACCFVVARDSWQGL